MRADFPGLLTPDGKPWHYLDTAATAQKPQAVIDAMVRAMGADYATVHRGVYARSAETTRAFEAVREKTAQFIGATNANEVVFVRGATEGINLVAHSWGPANIKAGDRIMLSQLEHHSNIVPWQMLAEKVGARIDICPLTEDGRIDLDWLEANLTEQHKIVALAHVSNVLGSVLGAKRAAKAAHTVGAKLLLDGCQSAPRMRLDMAELDCDFFVFSGHKLYGPTGVGVLWAREDILDAMPPWQGGGAMIDRVTFEKTTYGPPPQRFEAGTPMIAEVITLGAAIDYLAPFDMQQLYAHENALVRKARDELSRINSIRILGPESSAGIVLLRDGRGSSARSGHHIGRGKMWRSALAITARSR